MFSNRIVDDIPALDSLHLLYMRGYGLYPLLSPRQVEPSRGSELDIIDCLSPRFTIGYRQSNSCRFDLMPFRQRSTDFAEQLAIVLTRPTVAAFEINQRFKVKDRGLSNASCYNVNCTLTFLHLIDFGSFT